MYIDIPNIIEEVLNKSEISSKNDIGSVLENDKEVRIITKNCLRKIWSFLTV